MQVVLEEGEEVSDVGEFRSGGDAGSDGGVGAQDGKVRRRLLRRALIAAGAALCALALACAAYRWVAARHMASEVASALRDSKTGILFGGAPVHLGDGPRGVLLLHGFATTPRAFGELPRRLAAEGFQVSAPLLPGHGTRPENLAGEDSESLLAAAEDAYRDLRGRCTSVVIIGHSVGGTLAYRIATEGRTPPPDGLVLCCPFFGITYRWYAILPPATWARLISPVIPYFIKGRRIGQLNRRDAVPELVLYETVPLSAVRRIPLQLEALRDRPALPPPCPTLLIYCPGDGTVSAERVLQMADRWGLPESARRVLPRSNHNLFWDYDRDEAVSAVLEFMTEERSRQEGGENG
jgi:carboxylesterase